MKTKQKRKKQRKKFILLKRENVNKLESVKKSCQHIQTLIKELNSKSVALKKMKKVTTLIFIRNESIKKKS